METKMVEIRDSGTTIAALAIKMTGANDIEKRFLSHCGYPLKDPKHFSVILVKLSDCRSTNDPYEWGGGRTMPNAHIHIIKNWDSIIPGDVIDVEVILGERETPKSPEVGMYL